MVQISSRSKRMVWRAGSSSELVKGVFWGSLWCPPPTCWAPRGFSPAHWAHGLPQPRKAPCSHEAVSEGHPQGLLLTAWEKLGSAPLSSGSNSLLPSEQALRWHTHPRAEPPPPQPRWVLVGRVPVPSLGLCAVWIEGYGGGLGQTCCLCEGKGHQAERERGSNRRGINGGQKEVGRRNRMAKGLGVERARWGGGNARTGEQRARLRAPQPTSRPRRAGC